MIECRFYEKKDGNKVRCVLCPHRCLIPEGKRGICRARVNKGGTLYSLTYGRPTGFQADPIEKKPLYHFLPGTLALSFGTLGCNFSCEHCQNFELSTGSPKEGDLVQPETVVGIASEEGCASIAFTYNEPTIYLEYMIDIAKRARKEGIRTVMVSNGYIEEGPLKELCPHLDAANIDLKAYDDAFYREVCGGRLQPVLDALIMLKRQGVHLEVTNLIIPGKNDSEEQLSSLIAWVLENLGPDVPLHFSAFRPMHKMMDVRATPEGIVLGACRKAQRAGIRFVYAGNISEARYRDTLCPACGETVIDRSSYRGDSLLVSGRCSCGEPIPGTY